METEESNIVAFTGYRGEMTKNVLEMNFAGRQEWEKRLIKKSDLPFFDKYAFSS